MRALLIASLAILLLLTLGFAGSVPVQADTLDDDPDVVSEYARGKRFMRESDWLNASRTFLELIGRYPNSPNIDLFIFNRAKAELYLGDFPDAQAGFSHYLDRFGDRPAAPHAHFFLGNVSYLRGFLDRAVKEYVTAYGMATDRRLQDLCVESLQEAFRSASSVALTAGDLEIIPKDKACDLAAELRGVLVERQAYNSVKSLAEYCGRSYSIPADAPGSDYISGELEIALVLPLSGEYQTFGEDIYHGVVIAAEEYRQETGGSLKLVPYDTKGDPVATARILKELVNSGTDVAIGPLTSEAAAVGSAVLSCGDLPLLIPAATQAGLTMLSETSFQLSPNIELQGIRMAEYAVADLQADSAAIITPTGVDHLTMSRAFARRFKELGGTMVATEYYRPRDTDFGKQIRDLKALLIGVHPDSAFFIDERGDTLDADGIPAAIDCLYMP
ncbi:ABC transporter substrate-binding protein, partial [candidate division GN15 bacterium]|nr:ABC transporter substrate-binding protein [candidate division GN15 bacterium]